MKKSEIFDVLVDEVCRVCETHKKNLLNGCRVQAVVDARILIVQYLRRIGLAYDDIALIYMRKSAGDSALCPDIKDIKRKAKGVRKQFESYSQRCLDSYSFRLMSIEIRDFCRSKYKELYLSAEASGRQPSVN